jgi:hypothetical protein
MLEPARLHSLGALGRARDVISGYQLHVYPWYERVDICCAELEDVPAHDDAVTVEIISTRRGSREDGHVMNERPVDIC